MKRCFGSLRFQLQRCETFESPSSYVAYLRGPTLFLATLMKQLQMLSSLVAAIKDRIKVATSLNLIFDFEAHKTPRVGSTLSKCTIQLLIFTLSFVLLRCENGCRVELMQRRATVLSPCRISLNTHRKKNVCFITAQDVVLQQAHACKKGLVLPWSESIKVHFTPAVKAFYDIAVYKACIALHCIVFLQDNFLRSLDKHCRNLRVT